MKKETAKDFEGALATLEAKVKLLEEGDLPLEESLKVFEEGMTVAAFCRKKLEEAEQKVEVLLKGKDGTVRREPFPGAAESEPARTSAPPEEDIPF